MRVGVIAQEAARVKRKGDERTSFNWIRRQLIRSEKRIWLKSSISFFRLVVAKFDLDLLKIPEYKDSEWGSCMNFR